MKSEVVYRIFSNVIKVNTSKVDSNLEEYLQTIHSTIAQSTSTFLIRLLLLYTMFFRVLCLTVNFYVISIYFTSEINVYFTQFLKMNDYFIH